MNTQLNISKIENLHKEFKVTSLFGKWITFNDIEPLLKSFDAIEIGSSENNIPIYNLEFGTGKRRILIWSQMHGNESTGTKAIFDLINCLQNSSKTSIKLILKNCTIKIVPMLNPDGALVYTRVNANNIDLNRDAVDLKAKESKLLRNVLESFKPEFCFNLHDQRTIFGVEGTKNPASISFLAPSEEETRAITKGRKQTMNVIVAMNNLLQQIIPNHIGRYTDEFYPTATGDNFQKENYNTILIEAGHYKDDYNREEVRKFNFYALLQGLYHIAISDNFDTYEAYFNIPNNQKNFFDVINRYQNKDDIAYQYEDEIEGNKLISKLIEAQKGDLSTYIGHSENVFAS